MAVTNWNTSDFLYWSAVNETLAATGLPEATFAEMALHFEAANFRAPAATRVWEPATHPIHAASAIVKVRATRPPGPPPQSPIEIAERS